MQHKIPFELADVDVFHGEHRHANFVEMNPHEELPILVDGTTTVFGGFVFLFNFHQLSNGSMGLDTKGMFCRRNGITTTDSLLSSWRIGP